MPVGYCALHGLEKMSKMNVKKKDIGWIYVLSNPAMPGLLKIGFTQDSKTARRVLELSRSTSVPLPFVIEFEQLIENPSQYERLIHARLSQHRVSPDKEFFKVDLKIVEMTIRKIIFGTDELNLAIELQHLNQLYNQYPESFSKHNEVVKAVDELLNNAPKSNDDVLKSLKAIIKQNS